MSRAAACPVVGLSRPPGTLRRPLSQPLRDSGQAVMGAGERPWLGAGDEGQGHPLEEADGGMRRGTD